MYIKIVFNKQELQSEKQVQKNFSDQTDAKYQEENGKTLVPMEEIP